MTPIIDQLRRSKDNLFASIRRSLLSAKRPSRKSDKFVKRRLIQQFTQRQSASLYSRIIGITLAVYCGLQIKGGELVLLISIMFGLFYYLNQYQLRAIRLAVERDESCDRVLHHLVVSIGMVAFLWGSMLWALPVNGPSAPQEVVLFLLVGVALSLVALAAALYRPAFRAVLIGANLAILPCLVLRMGETGPVFLLEWFMLQLVLRRIAMLHTRQVRADALLQLRKDSLSSRLTETNEALVMAMDQLRWQADRDAMTRLRNRRSFERDVARLNFDVEEGTEFAVLLLDLDHFKKINDTFGHSVGDRVIVTAGRILDNWETEMPGRFTARWGGEEFIAVAILSGDVRAEDLAETLRQRFEKITEMGKWPESLTATASIGLRQCTGPFLVSEEVRLADLALYQAKSDGRNCWRKSARLHARRQLRVAS